MATNAKTLVPLPSLDKEDAKAILTLVTNKHSGGGLYSAAAVEFHSPGSISFELCGDYRRVVFRNPAIRATQKNIQQQHAAIFSETFIGVLASEALAFYKEKERQAQRGE